MLNHITIKKKQRFPLLDKIRGLAVVLMFISHSIDFFYNGDLLSIELIRWFTATVAFTTFIYVSGASNYIANVSHAGSSEVWQRKKLHILIKTLQLLIVYYFVAIVLSLLDEKFVSVESLAGMIGDILIFKLIPAYTEFLIAFILLSLSLVLFGRAYKFITKNSLIVIIVGINVYILGMLLYQVDFGEGFNQYKSLIVGHEKGYQFPVFQYFPIYIFGMKFGKELQGISNKLKVSWVLQLLLVSILTLLFAITKTWEPVIGEGYLFLQRWPPSMSFLIIGVVFVQVLIILYKLINTFVKNNSKRISLIEFIGKNPLDFYVIHILLLESYKTFIGSKTGDAILVFFGFVSLILMVSIVVYLKKQIPILPNLHVESKINDIINKTLGTMMKYFYRAIAIIFILGLVALLFSKVNITDEHKLTTIDEGFVKGFTAPEANEEKEVKWWNKDYKYNSELKVTNTDSEHLIPKNSWVALQINHSDLIEQQKSSLNGYDFSVVYLIDDEYQELDVFVDEVGTPTAKIYFQIQENLAPESTLGHYYLYYGNKLLTSRGSDIEKPLLKTLKFKVTHGEELSSLIVTELSRQWYLKDYVDMNPEDKNVNYKIQLSTNEAVLEESVSVIITDSTHKETSFKPSRIEDKIYEVQIPVSELDPGTYSIKTTIKNRNYESDTLTFNVSYPVFVTWTMDWEGYDITEENLKVLDDLAAKYNMPMTSFFNPRIFAASEINASRRARMVDWVISGQEKRGDEIALHLHMHLDMIKAVGLEPKTEPRWGGRENGHDVLTTAYEYDEFKKIVEWSIDQFVVNGLPKPVSYRAGGWFIDEENLRVLSDLGFKIDSSGREAIVYGPNKIENPWFLTSTTKPYKPSLLDQNISIEPLLNIWEYPNNGMDSTNRDFEVLKQKFDDNYKSIPVDETQVITYLSHPHWFTKFDQIDIDRLFGYIEPMKYENDSGAVVFSTLDNTLNSIEK